MIDTVVICDDSACDHHLWSVLWDETAGMYLLDDAG
jgi:hypothetical protein